MAEATMTGETGRYAAVQRWLHWIIAAVVFANLAGGLLLYVYGFSGLRDSFGMGATNFIYKYHKTFGVLVLLLMALRIAARYRLGAPELPAGMPAWQVKAAALSHRALYGLLIAIPVFGWAATAAGGFPVQFFDMTLPGILPKNEALSETLFWLHGLSALALVGILVLHLGAAYRHWKVEKDGVMNRISLP